MPRNSKTSYPFSSIRFSGCNSNASIAFLRVFRCLKTESHRLWIYSVILYLWSNSFQPLFLATYRFFSSLCAVPFTKLANHYHFRKKKFELYHIFEWLIFVKQLYRFTSKIFLQTCELTYFASNESSILSDSSNIRTKFAYMKFNCTIIILFAYF